MFHKLYLPEGELAEAVRGFVAVSKLDSPDPAAGGLNRFPAMPFCGLTLITEGAVALLDGDGTAAPHWLIFGPRTRPVASSTLAPLRCITAIFHAPAFRLLTGCEPALLRDRDEAAADWLPAEWQAWPLELAARAGDPDAQFAWMTEWLAPRWEGVRHALQAQEAGVGPRQRQRRSRALAGLGPAQLQRLARIEDALARLRTGEDTDLAGLAASLGYADQAHFTRETRALTGLPPARLLRAVQEDPDYWAYRIE
ncbi:helix-turn-helix domain-containing protein [Massilia sp. BSC265]|uniref:AraC family transcriptional regulator n=1 Tax=Massilia sp. BSC265 TaxID=1549812 RepID=UPI00068D6B9C|nr:helix-turn-helix domain-containing protein [Massilia sp. BSC265]